MNEEIIGIEVKGEIYAVKDEATAQQAEQSKRELNTAKTVIEELQTATETQAEKIATIEQNIGETDIQEEVGKLANLEEVAEEHQEAIEELQGRIISESNFFMGKPLFTLSDLTAMTKATIPTAEIPIVFSSSGKMQTGGGYSASFKFDLNFYENAITVKNVRGLATFQPITVPTVVGHAIYAIRKDYIKNQLLEKYPTLSQKIEKYFENNLADFNIEVADRKAKTVTTYVPGNAYFVCQEFCSGTSNLDNYIVFEYILGTTMLSTVTAATSQINLLHYKEESILTKD